MVVSGGLEGKLVGELLPMGGLVTGDDAGRSERPGRRFSVMEMPEFSSLSWHILGRSLNSLHNISPGHGLASSGLWALSAVSSATI